MTGDHRGPRAAPLLRGLGWDHGDSGDPAAIPRDSVAIPAIPENPIRPNEISQLDGLFANSGSSSARHCSNRCVLVAGSSGSARGLAKSYGSGKRAGEAHSYSHGGLLRRKDDRPRRSAYSDRCQCTKSRRHPVGLGARVTAKYGLRANEVFSFQLFRSRAIPAIYFHSARRSPVTKE
jgi:hypothetical protein